MTTYDANDEGRLIDYALGQLPPEEARAFGERVSCDEKLRKRHQDVRNTLSAVGLIGEIEPPEDLVERTMLRISRERRRETLIAREQLRGPVPRTTFSLRELMTVAAAVIVMAFVFVPSVRKARQLRQVQRCASGMGQVGSSLLYYANDNRGSLPFASQDRRRWLPQAGKPAVSNSVGLFKLVRKHYASPVLFQCPAVGGRSFDVRRGMKDFPGPKYVHYSYQHTVGGGLRCSDPALAGARHSMVILADSSPVFADGRFYPDRLDAAASRNHEGTGQNVLYLDMHVSWAAKPFVGVKGDNIFHAGVIRVYRGEEKPASATDTFLLPAFSGGESSQKH